MKRWWIVAATAVLLVISSMSLLWPRISEAQQRRRLLKSALKKAFTPQSVWSLDEVMAKLRRNPHDPYLQYVVLMLAQRENRLEDVVGQMGWQLNRRQANERRDNVDLFNVFSGALAVQESLQLDSMSAQSFGSNFDSKSKSDSKSQTPQPQEAKVQTFEIQGPTVKSHPWKQMLGNKKPETSVLSKMVPKNFYLIEFRSLTKLLDLMNESDLWQTHFAAQSFQQSRTDLTGDRIRAQLAIETNKLLQPFYDAVVEDVAATGSDLFFKEGSDITLLFRVKQPEIFRTRMDGFLAKALKAHPDATEKKLLVRGVEIRNVSTPDRSVNVFSAYIAPNFHLRSNSQIGMERVVEAAVGLTSDAAPVQRLGETDEFAFIRSLMPYGAKEEDGFIYLSDPFIHNVVGAQLKLTERRRMLCYNHMRMISHASLLFQSEHGKMPQSLAELTAANCAPGNFGEGSLTCPDGGQYSLAADGVTGVCSHHGSMNLMKPCCELELGSVTKSEADEYRSFVEMYNQYWRTYFDPIAIRVQASPKKYRLETIVLPLIDNSIYSGMATALGGPTRGLGFYPVPRRNVFSLAMQFDKEKLLKEAPIPPMPPMPRPLRHATEISAITDKDVEKLVSEGLGDRISLNVYDAMPYFDFSLSQTLGRLTGTMNRNGLGRFDESLWIGFLLASLNAPVYLVAEVNNETVVDAFLEKVDRVLGEFGRRIEGGFFTVEYDNYTLTFDPKKKIRCHSFAFGPIKWRIFWGRVGKGVCFATKPFIFEDLLALNAKLETDKTAASNLLGGPAAHAMVRIRPGSWDQLISEYRLGWAENQRIACLDNLATMEPILRSVPKNSPDGKAGAEAEKVRMIELERMLQRVYGQKFSCPDCGLYDTEDGRRIRCSIHGSLDLPRQPPAPSPQSPASKFFGEMKDLLVYLTFLPDGLHATVEIERK